MYVISQKEKTDMAKLSDYLQKVVETLLNYNRKRIKIDKYYSQLRSLHIKLQLPEYIFGYYFILTHFMRNISDEDFQTNINQFLLKNEYTCSLIV